MADATTAVEASVQDAIQRASAQTGVPVSVLQWIHSHEVNIGAQGPNQGTATVDAGNGVRCGGFFGLCTNSGLNNGSDPFTQALTTANLLLSYGKNTWQAAISAFNLGPNAPVGGYGAQYPGSGGPGGLVAQPASTQTPTSGQSIASAADAASPLGSGFGATFNTTNTGCQDWQVSLPSFFSGGSGSSFTLPGTRIFCIISGFITEPRNWATIGLLLLFIGLVIGGIILYVRGELL